MPNPSAESRGLTTAALGTRNRPTLPDRGKLWADGARDDDEPVQAIQDAAPFIASPAAPGASCEAGSARRAAARAFARGGTGGDLEPAAPAGAAGAHRGGDPRDRPGGDGFVERVLPKIAISALERALAIGEKEGQHRLDSPGDRTLVLDEHQVRPAFVDRQLVGQAFLMGVGHVQAFARVSETRLIKSRTSSGGGKFTMCPLAATVKVTRWTLPLAM